MKQEDTNKIIRIIRFDVVERDGVNLEYFSPSGYCEFKYGRNWCWKWGIRTYASLIGSERDRFSKEEYDEMYAEYWEIAEEKVTDGI